MSYPAPGYAIILASERHHRLTEIPTCLLPAKVLKHRIAILLLNTNRKGL